MELGSGELSCYYVPGEELPDGERPEGVDEGESKEEGSLQEEKKEDSDAGVEVPSQEDGGRLSLIHI